ncbi:DMT family transporter [Thermomicrobium sp. 4228-Ro]|uniref:DMT family transporter n=1 Tax=Thermomicrobium sp. 4228-Ro TaxID=2993937 RepID=UPI002248D3F1|nr:DMT family transporter [Thermomicrobium sp. 4228-Ro]MCX2727918.1 DMT family transporter [Thermomicrobium sp. 4228-Ro]
MARLSTMREAKAKRGAVVGHVLLATTAVLWGSSYISTRLIVGEVPPLLLGFLRGLLAVLVLGLMARWSGVPLRMRWYDWLPLAGLGALGVGYFYLGLNLALQWTTAVTASLLSLPYPALTALAAWLFLREPLDFLQVAGIALAGAGATWLTLESAQDTVGGAWLGNLLALSITVAWTVYTLLGRRILPRWSPLAATFHVMLAGTLLLGLGAGLEYLSGAHPVWTGRAILLTLYLGIVCTGIGYAFWNSGLRLVPAAAASAYMYLQPVTVLVLAIPVLGERPSLTTLVAGALVLTGTALAARRSGQD